MLHKKYTQLSKEEREGISRLKQQGKSYREIAESYARSPSTISREIKRNSVDQYYHPTHAHSYMKKRRYVRPYVLDVNQNLRDNVLSLLRKRWSPATIAHTLNYRISAQTIYRWIYRAFQRDKNPVHLYLLRRRAQKVPRTKYRSNQFLTPDLHKKTIHMLTSHIADGRIEPGHWELDTIMGKQRSCLVVLLERFSRFLHIAKLTRLQRDLVKQFVIERLQDYPLHMRKSIVCDNGQENMSYRAIEQALHTNVYFCDPYCSTQKAQIEHANGLIRGFFPKGTSFDDITEADVLYCQQLLNTRPRKCLEWRTPQDVHGIPCGFSP